MTYLHKSHPSFEINSYIGSRDFVVKNVYPIIQNSEKWHRPMQQEFDIGKLQILLTIYAPYI